MAWAQTAEQLKHELTDKYVVVIEGVPELKRFSGRTGTVRTVNMNGRALVEFEAPADISWYDIDPTYLTVIDAPLPKPPPPAEAEKAAETKPSKPAAKAKGGLSPLELARQQGAGGTAAAKPAAAQDKKLSPLELARQQGAASSGGDTKAATASPASPKPDAGKTLSPLEMARMQGAAKSGGEAVVDEAPASPAEAPAVPEETTPQPQAEAPAETPAAPTQDTSGMSKIELARMQGPFKG